CQSQTRTERRVMIEIVDLTRSRQIDGLKFAMTYRRFLDHFERGADAADEIRRCRKGLRPECRIESCRIDRFDCGDEIVSFIHASSRTLTSCVLRVSQHIVTGQARCTRAFVYVISINMALR